jgi:hydroxymethylglutaryl-CoA lyase
MLIFGPRTTNIAAVDQKISAMSLPSSVRVIEVGMRDGLQSVRKTLTTAEKVLLVESLLTAGVTEIEVASFSHPKVLPQMADAEQLLAAVPRPEGVRYRGLVPNAHGARRAVNSGVDELVALTCTDPEVTMINQNRTHSQMWTELDEILQVSQGIPVTVAIVMSFFAYGSGLVSPEKLDYFVDRIVEAGATSIYVADSAGLADPRQVHDAIARIKENHPELLVGVHLHTRGGLALANTLSALLANVDWIEGAFCGLGGDLWLPGDVDVLGNTPTEDLVAMLSYMGIATGIDLGLFEETVSLAQILTDSPTFGHYTRGGSRSEMEAIVWSELLALPGKEIPTTRKNVDTKNA